MRPLPDDHEMMSANPAYQSTTIYETLDDELIQAVTNADSVTNEMTSDKPQQYVNMAYSDDASQYSAVSDEQQQHDNLHIPDSDGTVSKYEVISDKQQQHDGIVTELRVADSNRNGPQYEMVADEQQHDDELHIADGDPNAAEYEVMIADEQQHDGIVTAELHTGDSNGNAPQYEIIATDGIDSDSNAPQYELMTVDEQQQHDGNIHGTADGNSNHQYENTQL